MFVRTHLFGVNNLHLNFSPKACICCLSDAIGLKAPISLRGNNYTLGDTACIVFLDREGVPSVGFTMRKISYPSTAFSTHLWWEKEVWLCRSWECWGAALPTQASDSWYHLHIRAILTLPFDCVITISLVLISFQVVQERLQAWVSQWTCFLLVDRINTLEKKYIWRKLCKWSSSKYFWCFHQENHTVKSLLLLCICVTNILSWNNYTFKIWQSLLVCYLKMVSNLQCGFVVEDLCEWTK